MRRIIAAVATAALAGTLLAGISYAESTHRARAARLVRVKTDKPAKRKASRSDDLLELNKLLTVKEMGDY